jgi:integrase
MTLTAKGIEKLRKVVGRYRDDGDGGVRGLYLSVPSKKGKNADENVPGGASWLLRYDIECAPRVTKEGNETNRRERWIGLGPLEILSLKQAREKAKAKRALLLDGIDPLDAKKAARTATKLAAAKKISFRKAAGQYLSQTERKWKNAKHRQQWANTLEQYAYPIIGDLAVADVDTAAVLRVLEQKYKGQRLWDSIPETASRLRGRIESILDWAKVRAYRTGDNPAAWDILEHAGLPARGKGAKHPALPYADIPEKGLRGVASFVAELQTRKGIASQALEFLVLTATRTGAVVGATWNEINLTEKIWTVPSSRQGAKISGDEDRRIPLSERAIEILKLQHREADNPFVFIGAEPGQGLGATVIGRMMKEMKYASTTPGKLAVPHGFRSCFKDWVSEETNFPNFVSEQALWHAIADKTEASYRRGDLMKKRMPLMEAWARFVGTPKGDASVVPIRRKAGG